MAEANWIKGTIAPPESGEYYVILEATQAWDSVPTGEKFVNAGEIEIIGDWYDAEEGYFQAIGKENPFWRVLSWAEVLKPSIPADIRDRVRWYFGTDVLRMRKVEHYVCDLRDRLTRGEEDEGCH